MTGCAICGTDDDCARDCPARLRVPNLVERIAAHFTGTLPTTGTEKVGGTGMPGLCIRGEDAAVYIRQTAPSSPGWAEFEARFTIGAGLTVAEFTLAVDHWSMAAAAITAAGHRYFG